MNLRRAGLASAILLTAGSVSAADFSVARLPVPGGIAALTAEACMPRVATRDDALYRVTVEAGTLGLVPDERPQVPSAARPAAMLPDGEIAIGRRNIRRAWLARPTGRYDHGVLGDAIEAAALVVELAGGRRLEFVLDGGSVFEDRLVRLADLDGDGADEAVAVRSYLDRGAALAVLAVADGRLRLVAETAPIGRSHRWLNPAGIADFDGDGRLEVALVVTPHIGGILRLYRLEDGRLKRTFERFGFSNHAYGSAVLRRSAVLDFDDDGVADLAIPTMGQRALKVVRFAGGYRELAHLPASSPLRGRLVACDLNNNQRSDLLYGHADGTLTAVLR